jgi:thiamine pyrophosphokinase
MNSKIIAENFIKIASQLGEYKSLICLNGDLPDQNFFSQINLPVIAVDGAANHLHTINITPELIIGDLDSINNELFANVKRIHKPDQNYFSDFEKTIFELEKSNLLPTIILGINGGFLDHILNNIGIFIRTNSIFFASNQIGLIIQNTLEIEVPRNTKLSLFGAPNATVSSNGLKWELNHYKMQTFQNNSCFNRTNKDNLKLDIHDGKALAIFYLDKINDAGSSN